MGSVYPTVERALRQNSSPFSTEQYRAHVSDWWGITPVVGVTGRVLALMALVVVTLVALRLLNVAAREV